MVSQANRKPARSGDLKEDSDEEVREEFLSEALASQLLGDTNLIEASWFVESWRLHAPRKFHLKAKPRRSAALGP